MNKTTTRLDYGMDVRGFIEQERHFKHAIMVSQITGLLTQALNWNPDMIQKSKSAAMLHDIGKNFIPPEILNKPDKLTAEEYSVVKTHAELGYDYLMSQVVTAPIIGWEPETIYMAAILSQQHHERLDGSGYIGLKGDDIHPLAKLVAVADVFDALYSQRPYKEPWSSLRVATNLMNERGRHFEPEYVDLALDAMGDILLLYKELPPEISGGYYD